VVAVGRLLSTELNNSAHATLNSHAYGYNVGSRRTNQVRADGSCVNYTYDSLGQLKTALGYENGGAARLHEKFGYLYDAAGNLNQRTNNALVQTFGVNSLNQLTTGTRSGTLTVAGTTTSAATNVTVNSQTATGYGDNAFAREGFALSDGNNPFTAIAQDSLGRGDTNVVTVNLPATVNFAYDQNGNLTGDGRRTLAYDDENQLVSAIVTNGSGSSTRSEFSYDGLFRRRVRKEYTWSSGTWNLASEIRYLYDGRLVLQERDANNLPAVTYTRGIDLSGSRQGAGGIGGLLARTDHGSGQSAFYHADGNGNITALVNGQQLVVARYIYDPFGNTLSRSGALADANLYRFSSKEYHEPSGLVYYLYRFYDPNLQRFVNRDPIEETGGVNLYGFLYNDPLNWIDPLGLEGSVDFKARAQCLCKCGWLKCDTARKLGERALEEARKRFPSDDSLHNGPGDAWRHCYWSCMMGDVIGKRCARIIGNAYEDSGDRHGQPPDEREMDDHNNRVGRSLAGKPGSCKDLCQKALDDGKLKVLR
jgi:RHS repeat-associated protein